MGWLYLVVELARAGSVNLLNLIPIRKEASESGTNVEAGHHHSTGKLPPRFQDFKTSLENMTHILSKKIYDISKII